MENAACTAFRMAGGIDRDSTRDLFAWTSATCSPARCSFWWQARGAADRRRLQWGRVPRNQLDFARVPWAS
eukprot:7940833-Pyramimonas_sp.AAC.1